MARRAKFETHVQPHLDKIAEWISQGAKQEEIAENLHIDKTGLEMWTSGRSICLSSSGSRV